MFRGSIVALVTPFKKGRVDEAKMGELVEFHIEKGTEGIVPCGCTGEAATLSHEEQKRTIKVVVEKVNKRVPVIAGTGSNSTEEALALTRYAREAGADGALLITPYYNKPTPQGQYLHYQKIASRVDIPLVLYNVPSRTGISMLPETVARLSGIDNIVAIKEASGSLDQVSQILNLCDITVLSGDDSLTLPMLSVGGKGVISVVANIVPQDTVSLIKSYEKKELAKAREIHNRLLPLCKAMFIETNPLPVKTAMGMMGMFEPEWRLPLSPMVKENVPGLKKALKDYGLIQ